MVTTRNDREARTESRAVLGTTSAAEKEGSLVKHQTVDNPASRPLNDAAKTIQPQATAGATADGDRADSGVGMDKAADGVQDVGLDDPAPEVKQDATPTAKKDNEALKALNPQNAQAPEVKADS